jgi:hypothetical protein
MPHVDVQQHHIESVVQVDVEETTHDESEQRAGRCAHDPRTRIDVIQPLQQLCLAIPVQIAGVLQNQRADLTGGACEGLASALPDHGFAKAWHEDAQNGTRRRLWTLQQHVVVRVAPFVGWTSKAEREQGRGIESGTVFHLGTLLDFGLVMCTT